METKRYLLSLTDAQLETLRAASPALDTLDGYDDETRALARELHYARPRTCDDLIELGQDELWRDYYGDVRSMAKDIVSEATEGKALDDYDDVEEDARERIHESVDGSQWIIYTARAMDVLRISERSGAYVEDFGTEGIVEDGDIHWSRLAYGAMAADVGEHVQGLLEEWKDAQEAKEETESEAAS